MEIYRSETDYIHAYESHENVYSMNNNEFTVKSYYCEKNIIFWDINRMSEYLIQMGNFSAISWEEKCTFRWDDIRFVLDQHA